jgi:hypothetical protein
MIFKVNPSPLGMRAIITADEGIFDIIYYRKGSMIYTSTILEAIRNY